MISLRQFLKCAVASAAITLSLSAALPVAAQSLSEMEQREVRIDALFGELSEAAPVDAQRIEQEIYLEFSHSGSDAMDLLLEKGRDAMQFGDYEAAIAHFTALVDHAPEFAEAYNARATAYFLAGLYGASMSDISKVLVIEPRHFGALSGLAVILQETGRDEQALAVLREVENIHPNMEGLEDRIARLELALGGAAL